MVHNQLLHSPSDGAWGQSMVGSLSRAGQASVMHCGNIARVLPEHAMQLQCTTATHQEVCGWPWRCQGSQMAQGMCA